MTMVVAAAKEVAVAAGGESALTVAEGVAAEDMEVVESEVDTVESRPHMIPDRR